MAKHLDPAALRFLGVQSANEVEMRTNQKADAAKQAAAVERVLIQEACDLGDSLALYATAHKETYTMPQIAWGVVLGTLCLRADYTDGVEKFDDLAQLADKDLDAEAGDAAQAAAPAPSGDNTMGAVACATAHTLTPEEEVGAARFSEMYAAYIHMKKKQTNVANNQLAYALGRALHVLWRSYPKGQDAFRALADQAGAYFNSK
jgi:hypothetical protein